MNKLKIAIIDLYNNERNEGMRCIKEIVSDSIRNHEISEISFKVFDTRYKDEIPNLDYDIFISSGGPGSPFEGEGKKWEKLYFNLLDDIWSNNHNNENKKYIFFICHSFQMMNRYFKIAEVNKRPQKSFGVVPFKKTKAGNDDPVLERLIDPFYAADFREYQVINPNKKLLNELGAEITAIETETFFDNSQPAVMAERISDEIVGTQFHPEADPESMLYHLKQEERKEYVINNFGIERYNEMLKWLEDPEKINLTRKVVLPSFLNSAIEQLKMVYK